MAAIRPPIFPPSRPAPAAPQRTDPAKVAAQRAFFDAALGKAPAAAPTQAAPQPSAPTAVSRSAAAPSLAPQASAEPPQKILRPGSLLDIKI